MPEAQSLPEITHWLEPEEPSQRGNIPSHRRDEPGASAQRKRYLASLDAADPAG
ncbi:hypothetical protein KBY94_05645 [Synechococcus sp. Cruz-9C9]|nr:hypothetical protein [Synechococcus sp. Edmonson 11F2]MCP9855370.1 hypothetical protein [Synechococcus sp. Cruz-9C9]MCP9862383.1 hypothetical protein [Synechococcus sp. Cruz-7E5]MCP9869655.1 hypothetical protein [Synechococcus sp. Cruz-7B9]